jgi:multidrug efflux pump subunit AcrA (membrane-fusion protein)
MRTWVFPIIRLLIFAVIAIALVKVAFFAETTEQADVDVPTGVISEPQYVVEAGSIRNNVKMTGTVLAQPAVAIPATLAGEVTSVSAKVGERVSRGDTIVTLRSETFSDTGDVIRKTVVVKAPTSGTLSSLTALVGQAFAVGDPIGQVAPPTFIVTGSLAPDQLYRLIDRPTKAKITIAGGPAPFNCSNLEITSPLAGAVDAGGLDGGGAAGGPTVTCSIPKSVTVFAGLAAAVSIPGGRADDVLVVPTTAVEGTSGTGTVFVVLPSGESEERAVSIGLTDGKLVEITDGLDAGETILRFIPGAPATPEGCFIDDTGAEICG